MIYNRGEGIEINIKMIERKVMGGGKLGSGLEEEIEIRCLSPDEVVHITQHIERWLNSKSKSAISTTLSGIDGIYKRDEPQGFGKRSGKPISQEIDTLIIIMGEQYLSLARPHESEEEKHLQIPLGAKVDGVRMLDFKHALTLNRVLYDFFRDEYPGTVRGLEIDEPNPINDATVARVKRIFERFGAIVRELKTRERDRPPLSIADEYDVQYLLHGLLRLYFEDIRDESYLKQHADVSPRIDFLLEEEKMGIEVKYMTQRNNTKKIGSQLAEDKERYRADPDVETLLCFIYDPEQIASNPIELEKDISEVTANLETRVTVTQL